MSRLNIRRLLLWFTGVVIGNCVFFVMTHFLQRYVLHVYALPGRVDAVSIVVSCASFALAGIVGGIVLKKVCSSAGLLESAAVGLPYLLLLAWLEFTVPISEVIPFSVIGIFATTGVLGVYCGILLTAKAS